MILFSERLFILSQSPVIFLMASIFIFFVFTKKNSTVRLLIVTMNLPVAVIMKKIKETTWSKMKTGVGSFVTAEVEEAEENTMEGRSRGVMSQVVGCVQALVGKKKFIVQSEDSQRREMNSSLWLYVSSKD